MSGKVIFNQQNIQNAQNIKEYVKQDTPSSRFDQQKKQFTEEKNLQLDDQQEIGYSDDKNSLEDDNDEDLDQEYKENEFIEDENNKEEQVDNNQERSQQEQIIERDITFKSQNTEDANQERNQNNRQNLSRNKDQSQTKLLLKQNENKLQVEQSINGIIDQKLEVNTVKLDKKILNDKQFAQQNTQPPQSLEQEQQKQSEIIIQNKSNESQINNQQIINNQENQENKLQEQNEEQQVVEKEKKIELRPKIIYDPKNDVDKYTGSYSDSGESEDENNDEEEEDEDDEESDRDSRIRNNKSQQKKINQKKEQAKKANVKKVLKKQTLALNVSDTKYQVVKFVGKKIFKWKLKYEEESMDWDIFWTDNAVQPEQLGKMQPYQKINHFPGMFSLARKNHLARNLMKMRKQFPDKYKFFPQTWLLPAEYNDFKTQFEKSKPSQKVFIVKPEASCQGRGIFLTRSLDDLNPTDHYVVQRYLTKPYLIDGLKLDFRLYVLLAGCDPLRIYLYYEGLARFATQPYKEPSKDNMEDMCMHLTNYAINKDNPNFQFNSDQEQMDVGHKRSLTSVLQLLEDQGHDVNKLWRDIKRVLIKTIISAQPTLAHHYKSCQPDNFMNNMCFEILGFDIILDSNLKPWLLEVNHTPSFVTDTPLDSYIKKNTIRDSLKLMNCSCKAKNEIVNQRKEIMQKRVLTGKKVKFTPEEKQEEIKKAQQKRDEYEDKHLGGFERIYPIEDDELDNFTDYFQHALKCYEQQTGANIRRNTKKVIEDPKRIPNIPKKPNQPKDLEKIYSSKIKVPSRYKAQTTIINKSVSGEQYPNNIEECQDEEMKYEIGENGQIIRSASGKMYEFRIKKQNSPFNIHQKMRNKMQQGKVAIGLKELKLGDDPIIFEDNPNNKPQNLNTKRISAYMTTQQSYPDKREQFENQNVLQDQNSQRSKQKRYLENQIFMISEISNKLQNLNPLKAPQNLQYQLAENNTILEEEEERRAQIIQAQRNLQYQLSQQQYQLQYQQQYQQQQRLTPLLKGPNINSQTSILQQGLDISNQSNNREMFKVNGGAIYDQYKQDRRLPYKQKGGNVIPKMAAAIQMKGDNGLFLQPKVLELQSYQTSQNFQIQQQQQQQLNVQNNNIDQTKIKKLQFRN